MIARIAWIGLILINALTVSVLVVPMIVSILVSFTSSTIVALPDEFSLRWYEEFFSDYLWVSSLIDTLVVAGLTILISFPIGLLAAVAFTRYALPWRSALNAAIMIPLFVPPIILGIGSLTFHRMVGLWGTHLSVAIAHSLWAIPLVFIVLKSALSGVDRSIEEAAAGLGASPFRVFQEVTLPLVASGVFVSVLFAFIISVNEFIMALFLATPDVKTLPVAIWPQIRYMMTPIVAAASTIIIVITVVMLGLSARLANIRQLIEYR